MAQIGEHQILMAEVPGSMLTGVTYSYWILLFSRSKACNEWLWNASVSVSVSVLFL